MSQLINRQPPEQVRYERNPGDRRVLCQRRKLLKIDRSAERSGDQAQRIQQ